MNDLKEDYLSDQPAYRKQYYCHSCMKYLEEVFTGPHKALNHKVETYLTMPNLPKYQKHEETDKAPPL